MFEWGELVFWPVLVGVVVSFWGLWRAGGWAGWRQAPGMMGVLLGVGAVMVGVTMVGGKGPGGAVGLGLYLVGVLVPNLMAQAGQRALQVGRYEKAARLMTVAAVMHPMDGWPRLAAAFRGYAAMGKGKGSEDEIPLELRQEAERGDERGLLARIQIGSMEGRWEDVLREVMERKLHERQPRYVTTYLRALGECRLTVPMVLEYVRSGNVMGAATGTMGMVARQRLRMMILALAGDVEGTRRLLAGPLREMEQGPFWEATARAAAGDETVRPVLEKMAREGRGIVAREAARRLKWMDLPAMAMSEQGRAALGIVRRDAEGELAMEGRRGKLGGKRGGAPVTWAIVIVNVVVFGFEVLVGVTGQNQLLGTYRLIQLGALVPAVMGDPGQWWRMLVANFLHVNFLHLASNMMGLIIMGPWLERLLGKLMYLCVYLITGIVALGAVAVGAKVGLTHAQILVGASACVMAVIGCTAGSLFRLGRYLPREAVMPRLKTIGIIVGLQVFTDAMTPQISSLAHILGLGAGLVMGVLLATPAKLGSGGRGSVVSLEEV